MIKKVVSMVLAVGLVVGMCTVSNAAKYVVSGTVEEGSGITMPENDIVSTRIADCEDGNFEKMSGASFWAGANSSLSTDVKLIGNASLKVDMTKAPADNETLTTICGMQSFALAYPDPVFAYEGSDAYKATCYFKVEGEMVDTRILVAANNAPTVYTQSFFNFTGTAEKINSGKWVKMETYITAQDFLKEDTALLVIQFFAFHGQDALGANPTLKAVYIDGFSIEPISLADIPLNKGTKPKIKKPKKVTVKTKVIKGKATPGSTVTLYNKKKKIKVVDADFGSGNFTMKKLNLKKFKNKTLKLVAVADEYETVSSTFKVKKK